METGAILPVCISLAIMRPGKNGASLVAKARHTPPPLSLNGNVGRKAVPRRFDSMGNAIQPQTLAALTSAPLSYNIMTPIQRGVLKDAARLSDPSLTGARIIMQSDVGTGKTLAYAIPAIDARFRAIEMVRAGKYPTNYVADQDTQGEELSDEERCNRYRQDTVGVIIVCPTREESRKVGRVVRRLAEASGLETHIFAGGSSAHDQRERLLTEPRDLIIGTPGRILTNLAFVPLRKPVLHAQSVVFSQGDVLTRGKPNRDVLRLLNERNLPKTDDRNTYVSMLPTSNKEVRFVKELTGEPAEVVSRIINTDFKQRLYAIFGPAESHLVYLLRAIALDQLTNGARSKVLLYANTPQLAFYYANIIRESLSSLPAKDTLVYDFRYSRKQLHRWRTVREFASQTEHASVLVCYDTKTKEMEKPEYTALLHANAPKDEKTFQDRLRFLGQFNAWACSYAFMDPCEKSYFGIISYDTHKLGTVEAQKDMVLAAATKSDSYHKPGPGSWRKDESAANALSDKALSRIISRAKRSVSKDAAALAVRSAVMFWSGSPLSRTIEPEVTARAVSQWCRENTPFARLNISPQLFSHSLVRRKPRRKYLNSALYGSIFKTSHEGINTPEQPTRQAIDKESQKSETPREDTSIATFLDRVFGRQTN